MALRQICKSMSCRYERWISSHGFSMLTFLCVVIIIVSALWSRKSPLDMPTPTPPVENAASAAELWQQTLRDVSTPTPVPSKAPLQWQPPLDDIIVLIPFDGTRMKQSSVTKVWQLHDAVDLAADMGEIVHSVGSGTVVLIEEDGLHGTSVTVSYPEGYEATYGSLSMTASLREGDPVKIGQTIGFAGGSMLSESDMSSHLHLRMTREGKAIDPLLLW